MGVINCTQCRKNWEKAIAQQIHEKKYDYFAEASDAVTRGLMIAFVAVLDRRKYSEQYVRKMFEEMLLILDYPEVFGRQLESEKLAEDFSKKYNIDFDRVRLKIENKKEFMHRVRKGGAK